MRSRSRSGRPVSPGDDAVRQLDRRILGLALPALGALVAEPLFILVDSAVVGHLGARQLAGLALAGSVLTAVVGLCVFLAYATTGGVARAVGAGDRRLALTLAVDALWLAAALGAALAVALWLAAEPVARALGAPPDVVAPAVAYLRWSAPGLPAMLVVLAATGALRGLLDTRTPLWVAGAGAVLNAVLSVALVLGLGMGVAGSGLGTALAQTAMGAALVAVLASGLRQDGVPLRPHRQGLGRAAAIGAPLLARTLSLRVAVLLATWVAAGLGTAALGAHQVTASVWGLGAFALDALAIAAQALVGTALGAADPAAARAVLRRCLTWGVAAGVALAVLLAAAAPWLPAAFTQDADVRRAATLALLVVAATLPMAGWVFVLDGVLIGAGDGAYLARAGVATLVAYVPAALAVHAWAPDGGPGLAWSWAAFAGLFMLARALTTGLRARGGAWLRLGVG